MNKSWICATNFLTSPNTSINPVCRKERKARLQDAELTQSCVIVPQRADAECFTKTPSNKGLIDLGAGRQGRKGQMSMRSEWQNTSWNERHLSWLSNFWLCLPSGNRTAMTLQRQTAGYSLQWRHNERDGVSNCSTIGSGKENIEAPRHWPLWGEFTGDRDRRKYFHLMTLSCKGRHLAFYNFQNRQTVFLVIL